MTVDIPPHQAIDCNWGCGLDEHKLTANEGVWVIYYHDLGGPHVLAVCPSEHDAATLAIREYTYLHPQLQYVRFGQDVAEAIKD